MKFTKLFGIAAVAAIIGSFSMEVSAEPTSEDTKELEKYNHFFKAHDELGLWGCTSYLSAIDKALGTKAADTCSKYCNSPYTWADFGNCLGPILAPYYKTKSVISTTLCTSVGCNRYLCQGKSQQENCASEVCGGPTTNPSCAAAHSS